ncbi:hypothetical protein RRG08_035045 [Elysia crispata]|uniref:Uncharacterized protein n=1 Tax=Elysia crispata TaxID=231223 RepID=A0AAE1DLA9_9GAST|nr:hypothetical protein RRG08_035045 [Elysia crispata]
MDGPFYPASMYTKDYQAASADGEISAHGYHGFMSAQAPACYYACSASAQSNGQDLGQGYFGAQAMAVVDQEEHEQQNFSSAALEQQLLHPAFSHLQHLQQQYHQNQQHSHHQVHPFLPYGVDEVAAHLAQSQAERLHQTCDIQQQHQHQHHHHHNLHRQQPLGSFSLNNNLNNHDRHHQNYNSGQSQLSSRGQAANIQQALLVDSMLSTLPAEESPNDDSLLTATTDPTSVHNPSTPSHHSPGQNQDACQPPSPSVDIDLINSCKQQHQQPHQQQQQQQQQPLPFPWMKTTKSHAHQWKAQWHGKYCFHNGCMFENLNSAPIHSPTTRLSVWPVLLWIINFNGGGVL